MDTYPSSVSDFPPRFFPTFLLDTHLSVNIVVVCILIICALLVLAAIISGFEVAFFSLDAKKWNELENDLPPERYAKLKRLEQEPKKLLAVLLISISFLNIGNIILMDYLLHGFIEQFGFQGVGAFLFKLLVEVFFILLFAEILPIIYANHNSKTVVNRFYPVVQFFTKIFSPLGNVLNGASYFLEKKLSFLSKDNLSAEELDHAIDIAVDEEKKILKGIVKFGNITATEIMRPRMDVVAINDASTYSQVLQIVRECGYSRLPVYHEDMDDIVGMLYSKDLIAHLDKTDDFVWKSLIREPLFVPENKKLDDLLNLFKSKRKHFAIISNEYGGTEGVVTLEDILEVVIGEIQDEFDDETATHFKRVNDKEYIVNARVPLHELCRFFDISRDYFEDTDEIDTLGGLMLELFKKIPAKKEQITYKDFHFEIADIDKNRIEQVKVTIFNLNEN